MRPGSLISLTLPHSPSFKSKGLTASTPVHEKSAETLFSRDYLGAFIDVPSIEAPTKGDVLESAEISEAQSVDPFVQLLINSRSPSVCSLNLYRGPETLRIKAKPFTEEVSDSFVVVRYEDSVIGSLKEMSDELDKLYKDHLDNTHSLSSALRQKDVNLYTAAQQYTRDIHTAYIKGKEQKTAQENAYIENFQAGNAAAQNPVPSRAVIAQITEHAGPSSVNESAGNQQAIPVETLTKTIAKLNAFIDQIDKAKLDETNKKNSLKYRVSDFVTKHSVIETGAKIVAAIVAGVFTGTLAGLAAGAVAGTIAATMGIALGFAMQYFLTQYASNVLRQFDNQYAFSEALNKILKSGLSKVEKMSGIGGITPNQLGYTAGQINGSIQNLDNKLDKFVTQDQLEAFGKAQIGVVDSTVEKAVERAAIKIVASLGRKNSIGLQSNSSTSSLNSDTTLVGSPPKSPPREETDTVSREEFNKAIDEMKSQQEEIAKRAAQQMFENLKNGGFLNLA